jgi:hypothetical protein
MDALQCRSAMRDPHPFTCMDNYRCEIIHLDDSWTKRDPNRTRRGTIDATSIAQQTGGVDRSTREAPSRSVSSDGSGPADAAKDRAPRQRHTREIVSRIRVNLTEAEAQMLARIQENLDVPYCQVLRLLIRDEYKRSFSPVSRAFGDLDK